jgi:hypothetical protein
MQIEQDLLDAVEDVDHGLCTGGGTVCVMCTCSHFCADVLNSAWYVLVHVGTCTSCCEIQC